MVGNIVLKPRKGCKVTTFYDDKDPASGVALYVYPNHGEFLPIEIYGSDGRPNTIYLSKGTAKVLARVIKEAAK